MILANSTWGGWLADCGVPGIYRSQASLAPGVQGAHGHARPAPHAGIGVAQYAWSTSPLRRYVDLVNQWQIIACARHGRTAALAAPFKPKDVQLFSIDLGLRRGLRRLQRVPVGDRALLDPAATWRSTTSASSSAAVMKDGLVRADELPLVFRALGAANAAARHRGAGAASARSTC